MTQTLQKHYKRTSGQSDADTSKSVSTSGNSVRELVQVLVTYSASPTYTGSNLTVEVDSGLGTAYDGVLQSGTSNARYFQYTPSNRPVIFADDEVKVTAPGGGGVITSTITIITKEVSF